MVEKGIKNFLGWDSRKKFRLEIQMLRSSDLNTQLEIQVMAVDEPAQKECVEYVQN